MPKNKTPKGLIEKPRLLPISDTTRYFGLMILSAVMGFMEMWLWKFGHTDQYGLFFGLAFIGGALYCARQYIKYRKKRA